MYNARLANGDSDLENITTVQCEMSGVFRPIESLRNCIDSGQDELQLESGFFLIRILKEFFN